jgi:hypothetical protein
MAQTAEAKVLQQSRTEKIWRATPDRSARQRGCLWGGRVGLSVTAGTHHSAPSFHSQARPGSSPACFSPPHQPRGIPSPDSHLHQGNQDSGYLAHCPLLWQWHVRRTCQAGFGEEGSSLGSHDMYEVHRYI